MDYTSPVNGASMQGLEQVLIRAMENYHNN